VVLARALRRGGCPLADLVQDDLVFLHRNGSITSTQEWMGQVRSRWFVHDRIDLREASVRTYGDTAVLVGEATFVVNGGSVYELVCTEVYPRKNGQWKLANLQPARAGPDRPAASAQVRGCSLGCGWSVTCSDVAQLARKARACCDADPGSAV
jgi:hypothetical protein